MRSSGAGLGELGGEFAEHQVLAALPDQAERGDVPEHRGAAVAEHDFPTVGQAEQRGELRAYGPDQVLHRGLAVRGTEHRVLRRHGGQSTCSGRTFDGPQPNRPSAGRRSDGMTMVAGSTVTGPGWPGFPRITPTRFTWCQTPTETTPAGSSRRGPSTVVAENRLPAADSDALGSGTVTHIVNRTSARLAAIAPSATLAVDCQGQSDEGGRRERDRFRCR